MSHEGKNVQYFARKGFSGLLQTAAEDRQSSERGRDEVTYFYVGDVFLYTLALSMPIFKKNLCGDFWEKVPNFTSLHCNNVTTMKSLELFPRNHREDFFLKIDILSPKVYTKNVPNIKVCDFIPGPSSVHSFTDQASHCSTLLIEWLHLCARVYHYI